MLARFDQFLTDSLPSEANDVGVEAEPAVEWSYPGQ